MDSDSRTFGSESRTSSFDSISLQELPSQFNLDTLYRENVKYASATQRILPPTDFHSPYYIPFNNIDDPRPIDQLIYRLTIWKMIIKQVVFYFQEMSIFKKQTFLANRAMLETLEVLKKQNSGKLKNKAQANKGLKKSLSNVSIEDTNSLSNGSSGTGAAAYADLSQSAMVNKLLQTTFLPPGDHSVLSISNTYFDSHNAVKERELVTYQQLSNKLIPKLENLKDQLNGVIEQMTSLKSNQGFKTKTLKMEIAKTGAILSDYLNNIELFRKGETKTRLGTLIKIEDSNVIPKDPYLLKLKLDLQVKDQLYTEARLKDMYYDLQKKAVQLEKILYAEIQNCIATYTDLIDAELNAVKDNMIQPFRDGFLKNSTTMDWDYFIRNDKNRNFLNLTAEETMKPKVIRKTSDVVYPYRQSSISSCLLSGYLDRKSKYLKNYSRFYYVLTLNYLHEFKTNDRKKERHPVSSMPINNITVSIVEDDPKKFVLRIVKKDEGKTKSTFKCESAEVASKWIEYLSDLTDFDSVIERNNSYEDEEDEEQAKEDIAASTVNENSAPSIYSVPSVVSVSTNPMIGQHNRIPSDHSLDNYFPPVSKSSTANVTFRSIKSNNTIMPQTSARYNGGTGSRSSSRASSRASSPSRGRLAGPMRTTPQSGYGGITSPNTTSPQSIGNANGDYFSFRGNVRASLTRLPSGGSIGGGNTSNGRVTPASGQGSSLTIPTNNNSNSLPIINVVSSPKDGYFNIDSDNYANNEGGNGNGNGNGNEDENESGLDRRRKTLTERLKIGVGSSGSLLQLPSKNSMNSDVSPHLLGSTIPSTPGIIPGSRLDGMFNIEEQHEGDN